MGDYLTITGVGSPERPEFGAAVQALYSVAWTLKMASKRAGRDFKVMTLEGIWWGPVQDRADLQHAPGVDWHWKLVIRVPDFVSESDVRAAQDELVGKGRAPSARMVQLERIDEGECVQALHVGPYGSELETIKAMSGFARANGRVQRGPHHEIYLSDPNRTTPERLRTILRHPVARANG
jgi:hypothetical protein